MEGGCDQYCAMHDLLLMLPWLSDMGAATANSSESRKDSPRV
jgi:hypothetical protein